MAAKDPRDEEILEQLKTREGRMLKLAQLLRIVEDPDASRLDVERSKAGRQCVEAVQKMLQTAEIDEMQELVERLEDKVDRLEAGLYGAPSSLEAEGEVSAGTEEGGAPN